MTIDEALEKTDEMKNWCADEAGRLRASPAQPDNENYKTALILTDWANALLQIVEYVSIESKLERRARLIECGTTEDHIAQHFRELLEEASAKFDVPEDRIRDFKNYHSSPEVEARMYIVYMVSRRYTVSHPRFAHMFGENCDQSSISRIKKRIVEGLHAKPKKTKIPDREASPIVAA